MRVSAFADIEKDFLARVRQIVWCSVATVDRRGRPRSRILHPLWEGRIFPACEAGAMPPFGNLYGLPVWVDQALTRDKDISFNAGTHEQTVRMAYADFARLVQPRVASFGMQARAA